MSHSMRMSILGAVALLSVACSQQEPAAPETTATAPVEQAPAAATDAPVAAPATGLRPITVVQLDEKRINAPSSCNIEAVDQVPFKADPITKPRAKSTINGWFLSESSKATGVPAVIRFEDEAGTGGWETDIVTWTARPDVLAAMKGVDAGNAGFHQEVDLSSFAPGAYRLSIVFADGGAQYSCDNNRIIVVE